MKLLHFADVHIGVETYGRIDPDSGLHTRLQDFVGCLSFAVEVALQEQVDLVVFAGDAYKNCDPNPTHQREFARQIKRLSDRGIPVVMIVGNHDHPVAYGKASAIEIFGTLGMPGVYVADQPGLLRISTRGGEIQVVCFPWPTKNFLLALELYKDLSPEEAVARVQEIGSEWIASQAGELDSRLPSVLLAHLAADGASYAGSERTILLGKDPVFLPSVLAHPAFTYVALGHIHKFQDLNPGGRPPVVYSGSLDRINFGEERDKKGFCLVELERAGSEWVASCQLIRTPARPFLTILVKVQEGEEPTAAILGQIRRHNLCDAVVRVSYSLPEGSQEAQSSKLRIAHSSKLIAKTGIPTSYEPRATSYLATSYELSQVDLKAVHAALQPAFLVAGVVREVEPSKEAAVRVALPRDVSLEEALEQYLNAHPELRPQSQEMKEYARHLQREIEEGLRR